MEIVLIGRQRYQLLCNSPRLSLLGPKSVRCFCACLTISTCLNPSLFSETFKTHCKPQCYQAELNTVNVMFKIQLKGVAICQIFIWCWIAMQT